MAVGLIYNVGNGENYREVVPKNEGKHKNWLQQKRNSIGKKTKYLP